jgi:hypothetical protein
MGKVENWSGFIGEYLCTRGMVNVRQVYPKSVKASAGLRMYAACGRPLMGFAGSLGSRKGGVLDWYGLIGETWSLRKCGYMPPKAHTMHS